ncbi:MAG: TonB-dependent receptor, partial [Gemmatimonadetes bacterium]|nr:TonB-dependent receptor [Gemmatimonadota bacterium]
LLAAAPGGAVRAAAQEMGRLEGALRDAAGAPVAGARVEAQLQGAAFQRGTTTDASGAYRLTGLPAGRYLVQVRLLGYATTEAALALGRGEARGHDFLLRVRALVIDTVTVTTRNPATISREDTEFATVVNEAAIRLLPMRPEVREVVALTPGARADGQVWGGATQQANNYQLDGISANHPGVGGDLVQPSLSWIESVEVRGLGAAAEHGNFQGGLVNLVTKSGGNRLEGGFRAAVDAASLTSTNLQQYDVASETDARYDVEGEVRGPIVRDRLFYYLAGQLVHRTDRVVNHLATREEFFAPDPVVALEARAFGKLSWAPARRDQVTLSGGYTDQRVDRFGATGYEEYDAYLRASAPTLFFSGLYRRLLGAGTAFEASAAGFTRDERRVPFLHDSVPGVVLYGEGDRPTYRSPAMRHRLAPSSLSAGASLAWEMRTGGLTHQFKAGGELSAGRWIHERIRNGGMTWRPDFGRYYHAFNHADTRTWGRGFVPVTFGGEVRLNTDVHNAAAYLQDHIDIGSRVSVSPGVRLGWWTGYLTPAGDVGPRFRAVRDRAWDPRLGLTVDLTGSNQLVLKGHWGRYHQGLFAQFYDRAEGGNVFQNEQLWYYFGMPESPWRTFGPRERDALALSGKLQLQEEFRQNQTGPVENYRQPYVDQLVVGLERQMGRWWKAELVYVNRRNANMVALVDRNAATNYTMWENVLVYDAAGEPVTYDGEQVVLRRMYLANYMLVDQLKTIAQRGTVGGLIFPPGMVLADTLRLTWDPDYVLTTVPEARRTFHQAQFVVRMGHPRHGGMASLVWTRLRGNLDNVSGYHESQLFAGPYVNPNQGVNADGWLANSSQLELKVWLYGALRWGFRGGLFTTQSMGDRVAPTYNLSSAYAYDDPEHGRFHPRLITSVAGQPVFVLPRGERAMPFRSVVDLHLERGVRQGRAEWTLTMDAFNVLGMSTPTRYNTAVNGAIGAGGGPSGGVEPEREFGAVRERVRPRSVRLGAAVRF